MGKFVDYVVTVKSYDEGTDEFQVEMVANWGGADPRHSLTIPGHFLGGIIRQYGEPDELVGQSFEICI